MGNMEQHLGHATTATSSHYQPIDLWRNPRGTVVRIQIFALVAIALSFFLVAFGSCRRWSNRWLVQKGFLALQVLPLSLGIYSIGLMQSSSAKSEMYPVWTVSLITLFGCVDPITNYVDLDYMGPFIKVIFQLCLYCGYALLMSVSTISSVVGNSAIGVLSAITFIKGFHRSLALVLPSSKRNYLKKHYYNEAFTLELFSDNSDPISVRYEAYALEDKSYRKPISVRLPVGGYDSIFKVNSSITMADIHSRHEEMEEMLHKLGFKEPIGNRITFEEVCLGYSLSHVLERRFLGLDTSSEMKQKRINYDQEFRIAFNYKRILKVIEIELAFLYEVFFTSNEFLYYYEARTCSLLAMASFVGICLVGVATGIPGTMASRHHTSHGAGNTVVVATTTTADLVVTLVILVLLAVLQLVQLIWCWASNWGTVAIACEFAATRKGRPRPISWQMRLKALVATRMNWFDKYLWQDQLGQYSLVGESWRSEDKCCSSGRRLLRLILQSCCKICDRLAGMQYIGQLLREVLVVKGGAGVRLDEVDVKTCIAEFIGRMKHRRIDESSWSSLSEYTFRGSNEDLPFGVDEINFDKGEAKDFTKRVMLWHVATSYCELAEQEAESWGGEDRVSRERNRRVAIALSRYCAYLAVSAPDLLPGPTEVTKEIFDKAAEWISKHTPMADIYKRLPESAVCNLVSADSNLVDSWLHRSAHWRQWDGPLILGVRFGQNLLDKTRQRSSDPWEVLAELWVRTLVFAAPFGDRQAHMQHLSRGGEFITHLWALLYHIGIDRWQDEGDKDRREHLKIVRSTAGSSEAVEEREEEEENDDREEEEIIDRAGGRNRRAESWSDGGRVASIAEKNRKIHLKRRRGFSI